MPLAIVPQLYSGKFGLLTFRRKHAEEELSYGIRRPSSPPEPRDIPFHSVLHSHSEPIDLEPHQPVVQTGIAVTEALGAEAVHGIVIQDPHDEALETLDAEWRQCFAVAPGLHIHKKLAYGMWSTLYVANSADGFTLRFVVKATPMIGVLAEAATAQIAIMKSLQHPNIITFHDTFIHMVARTNFLCIKMDYCRKGSLRQFVEKEKKEKGSKVTGAFLCDFLHQIASALAYIHEREMLHGDLRLENVLCTNENQLKLTNFATTSIVPRQSDTALSITGGQRMYAPPEWVSSAFSRRPLQSFEVPEASYDMWGFGCILSELVTLQFIKGDRVPSNEALASNEMALARVQDDLDTTQQGAFSSMARQLFQVDPDARMTARAAVAVLEALLPQLATSHGSRGHRSLPSLRSILSART